MSLCAIDTNKLTAVQQLLKSRPYSIDELSATLNRLNQFISQQELSRLLEFCQREKFVEQKEGRWIWIGFQGGEAA